MEMSTLRKPLGRRSNRFLGNNIERFVKHYATHKYRTSVQEGVSDYKLIRDSNKGIPTVPLLDDIYQKSIYYNRLLSPSQSEDLQTVRMLNLSICFFQKASARTNSSYPFKSNSSIWTRSPQPREVRGDPSVSLWFFHLLYHYWTRKFEQNNKCDLQKFQYSRKPLLRLRIGMLYLRVKE